MSFRRHHNNTAFEEAVLLGIELLNTRLQLLERLMSAELDDLNARLDALTGVTQSVVAKIDELKSAQGVPAADVAAAAAKLQPVIDQLTAAVQ